MTYCFYFSISLIISVLRCGFGLGPGFALLIHIRAFQCLMTSLPSFPPQIHRKAYLAALADTRAKNIPKRSEYLSTMTTRSYTSTYYDNIPWNELGYVKKPSGKPGYDTKVPEMKKILGNNSNLYEYYPGGKKNPLRKVNNKSKARAAH